MKKTIGDPIIDELKICYVASTELLTSLTDTAKGDSYDFSDFIAYRTTSIHFKYAYDICIGSMDCRRKIASIRFGRYGDSEETNFIFYRIENYVLYNHELFKQAMAIPQLLNLTFHNFTSLDIAIDQQYDVAHLIKRLYRRKDITTIINGKAIKDRKETLKNLYLTYSTSLDRLKSLSVNIKQKKALHDKTRGITVQAYNKMNEIQDVSHKQYICEFYGFPNRLYRLEVHLNNAEIKDYCNKYGIHQDESMISDQELLSTMFFYHLSSVIRFTKGRTKLYWTDILKNNGRV